MTTYKGINGFAVQSVATDPSPLDEGQVWYNNATYAFKLASLSTVGTWAAGGNLNTARAYAGAAGTQTAGLFFGGISYPSFYNVTESYNGTSWTTLPATMNTTRYGLGSANAGTQTAALGFGGEGPGGPPTAPTATESYNGTSWTSVNSLNTAKNYTSGFGTQGAAINFGNYPQAPTGVVESWNGTSWTTVNSMSISRGASSGCGVQTAGLAITGQIGPGATIANVEGYNGTSWATYPNSSQAKDGNGATGTQAAALNIAGYNGGTLTSTEEWTASPFTTTSKTLTVS